MDAHTHPEPGARQQRPSPEVADIVRAHRESFVRSHSLSNDQHAVLRDIARCRTAALGGHLDVCHGCGLRKPSYNSCRNRHCPKCQSLAQARWIALRIERILPTHCFHVVFTLPQELRRIALENRETVFDMLFAAASSALLDLGRDPKWIGAQLGVTAVLHTWTRELLFHPHVHCIVTGGGLSLDGLRWVAAPKDYLFPVRVLGDLFRNRFVAALKAAHRSARLRLTGQNAPLADATRFERLCNKLLAHRWVVYCKRPFGGPVHVFHYLGRYTHRTGISNQRLVSLDDDTVTFRTRGDSTLTLMAHEFLRRFLLHVLPKRFVKIRHYGLMAASNVSTSLETARQLLLEREAAQPPDLLQVPKAAADALLALTGIDITRCPACGCALTRYPLDPFLITIAPHDTS